MTRANRKQIESLKDRAEKRRAAELESAQAVAAKVREEHETTRRQLETVAKERGELVQQLVQVGAQLTQASAHRDALQRQRQDLNADLTQSQASAARDRRCMPRSCRRHMPPSMPRRRVGESSAISEARQSIAAGGGGRGAAKTSAARSSYGIAPAAVTRNGGRPSRYEA